MTDELYPAPTRNLTRLRRKLAPGVAAAFHDFSEAAFAEGAPKAPAPWGRALSARRTARRFAPVRIVF